MKLKDILNKVLKGEALTDDEKKVVSDYDGEQATNAAAAAARRTAEADRDRIKAELEAKLAELQTKLEAEGTSKLSDLQKAQAQVDALTKKFGDIEKTLETEKSEKGKLIRQTRINELASASGLRFVDNVDPRLTARAIADAFEGLSVEDLADAVKVKPVVEAFKASNKGLLLDASGHGTGFKGAPNPGAGAVNPWAKTTFNLTAQGELYKTNPQLAAQMKAAAGA